MKYAINGKFLCQKITGVQRFSYEIVKELDKIVPKGEFVIVMPKRKCKHIKLNNIEIVAYGLFSGNVWEQISFPHYLIKNGLIGINLGNVAPIIKPDIVCIHDMNLIRHPQWFSKRYVMWSKIQYRNTMLRAKMILTVSNFSKREIDELYPQKKPQVYVLSEGWQHMQRIIENESALNKYNLPKNEYFFSLYQAMPNKNFQWIVKVAQQNPDKLFVVSGWHNKKVNAADDSFKLIYNLNNVKVLGYLSDEDMKCILKYCKAFLFPSTYEGFGIPPLEAMAVGANVVVSDIPVMHEILGNCAQYIVDQNNTELHIKNIDHSCVLNKYSWEKAAYELYSALA